MGIWDLDSGDGVHRPALGEIADAVDQIVLVRLHNEPVGIVHLPTATHELPTQWTDVVWDEAGPQIIRHAQRCGCIPVPISAADLRDQLPLLDSSCRCREPIRPAGRAAVILCTTGRLDVLERALDSLCRLRGEDFEIVVVDNRPAVETEELATRFSSHAPVRYVAEARPGLSRARNAGVAATADAEFVAFTDDDVMVDEQWLAWLLHPFSEPEVDVVTGLPMPLTLKSVAEKRFEQYAGFGKGVISNVYDIDANRSDERLLYPFWGGMFGSGNSMAFRRRALQAAGGFDLALGAGTPTGGGEDTVAFTDILLAGGRLVYEPRSVCWHEHRADETALRAQVRNYGIGLTAVFWRYLWRDRRFLEAAVRSVPVILRLLKNRREDRGEGRLLEDLSQVEMEGRLLGPWRYIVSRRLVARQ